MSAFFALCAGFFVKRESELLFFISERKAVCSAESIFELYKQVNDRRCKKKKTGVSGFPLGCNCFFVMTSFVYSVSVFASG